MPSLGRTGVGRMMVPYDFWDAPIVRFYNKIWFPLRYLKHIFAYNVATVLSMSVPAIELKII